MGSFQNEGVKQDFGLDVSQDSVVGRIEASMGGRRKVARDLGVSLNVFNSASLSIPYALALLREWDKDRRLAPVKDL